MQCVIVYNNLKKLAILPTFNFFDEAGIVVQLTILGNTLKRNKYKDNVKLFLIAPNWFLKHNIGLNNLFNTIESDLPDDLLILSVPTIDQLEDGIIFGSDDGITINSLFLNKEYNQYYATVSLTGKINQKVSYGLKLYKQS